MRYSYNARFDEHIKDWNTTQRDTTHVRPKSLTILDHSRASMRTLLVPKGTKRCSHGREPMDSVARTTGEPRRAEGAKGEANVRVPFVPSGLRVVSSMFHGLTPMAITFRHFVAMSERRFAANRILIRRSPARRRIDDRIRFGG